MHIFALDGHPDIGRLSGALLDAYCEGAQSAGHTITRMALGDMDFDPVLKHGYRQRQDHEPDLLAALEAIRACDHFVLGFPMWWGSQPAKLKGFLDRLFLPGIAFDYVEGKPFPAQLFAGRSAAAFITGETPGWWLSMVYKSPIIHQTRRQVLGFCGFKPVKVHYVKLVRNAPEADHLPLLQNAKTLGEAAPAPKSPAKKAATV